MTPTDASAAPPPRAFALHRERLELRFRSAVLAARELLTADYVRVRVVGDELAGFGSAGHDDHVRIFLPEAPPSSVDEMRAAPSREFTPLRWGVDEVGRSFIDLEFALHGDDGVASRWAQLAPIGAPIGIGGPRGALRISGDPTGWLLAGDETAIAQIRRYAALIPVGAPARILVEVPARELLPEIAAPVPVTAVERGDATPGSALAAALDRLESADRPGADPFVFAAAEQRIVRPARALLARWGVDAERAVVKGYWKRGDTAYHAAH